MAITQKIRNDRDIKNASSVIYNDKTGNIDGIDPVINPSFDISDTGLDERLTDTSQTIIPFDLIISLSDETTNLSAGTAKSTFRMPFAGTLESVSASVNTAPTGSAIIVDINVNDSTILSTKLTIDATEKTSATATPAVISNTALAIDDEVTIDIDQIGSSVAGKGLKITLTGTRA